MADETYNIVVGVKDDSEDAGRTFTRTAEDIADSAKKAEDSAKKLGEGLKGLKKEIKEAAEENGLKEAFEQVKQVHEGMAQALEKLNQGLRALGIGAVVIEFQELFEVAKELEDVLNHLRVASGATEESMEKLKETTRELSNSFGQSQMSVATAQLIAAKSGFVEVEDISKVTTAALELSTVSFEKLGVTARAVGEVLNAYGLSAEEANKVQQ